MKKLKIGDKVKILAGEQKGKIGTISAFFQKVKKKNKSQIKEKTFEKERYVYIKEIPTRLKYIKAQPGMNEKQGELQKKEIPVAIHISNITLWLPNNSNVKVENE